MNVESVEQTNLFEFIGLGTDPVFNKLERMRTGDEIQIGAYMIRKTRKLYEVETKEVHEGFSQLMSCYSFISSNL